MKEFIVTVHDVRSYRVRMRDKFARHSLAAADQVSEPARGGTVQLLTIEQWSTTRKIAAKRRRK